MRNWFFAIALGLCFALVGCDNGGDGDSFPESLGDCPSDSSVTWATVEPLFATNCTNCHASTLVGVDRQYAPLEVDYDTEALAGQNAAETWDRIVKGVNGDIGGMPTGDQEISSQADALLIREWLSCQATS